MDGAAGLENLQPREEFGIASLDAGILRKECLI
jgi:hypothetical protein